MVVGLHAVVIATMSCDAMRVACTPICKFAREPVSCAFRVVFADYSCTFRILVQELHRLRDSNVH